MLKDEPKGSFTRWQAITIGQLTYAINLVLTFSVATVGFQVTLLLGDKFYPVSWQKCAFGSSIVLNLIATALGLLCVYNRLQDFRTTAQAARMREKEDPEKEAYRNQYRHLGERTWLLCWWQLGTFGFGILLNVLAVAASVSGKLL